MMLDRQHLTLIRQVVRSGGVTAAAEALNLSQSAVIPLPSWRIFMV
jgi:DNA-binding transcriptional LysR family regulator